MFLVVMLREFPRCVFMGARNALSVIFATSFRGIRSAFEVTAIKFREGLQGVSHKMSRNREIILQK